MHQYIYIYIYILMSLKEIQKSKWLRFILVNSQIVNFQWLLFQLLSKQLKQGRMSYSKITIIIIIIIIIPNKNSFRYKIY